MVTISIRKTHTKSHLKPSNKSVFLFNNLCSNINAFSDNKAINDTKRVKTRNRLKKSIKKISEIKNVAINFIWFPT